MAKLAKPLPKKEKVTVSIDAALIKMIDDFVEESGNLSRSAVFEQAIHLWKQEIRDAYDLKYYSENADIEKKENESWKAVSSEAAKYIWKE